MEREINVTRLETLSRELRRRNPLLPMAFWGGCACGWAAINMPEFNLLGFTLETLLTDPNSVVMGFFGLRRGEMIELFCPCRNLESGVEVADRIDMFLADLKFNGRDREPGGVMATEPAAPAVAPAPATVWINVAMPTPPRASWVQRMYEAVTG